jgi:hypothetical protein
MAKDQIALTFIEPPDRDVKRTISGKIEGDKLKELRVLCLPALIIRCTALSKLPCTLVTTKD